MKKEKSEQTKDWKTNDEFWCESADFFVTKKWREKKDEQGNFKKQEKIKRIISHAFVKKKQKHNKHNKRREKKKKMAEKEKAEDVFSKDEKQDFFQIHHNRQAKNAKTGETIFQDTEKRDKTRKM